MNKTLLKMKMANSFEISAIRKLPLLFNFQSINYFCCQQPSSSAAGCVRTSTSSSSNNNNSKDVNTKTQNSCSRTLTTETEFRKYLDSIPRHRHRELDPIKHQYETAAAIDPDMPALIKKRHWQKLHEGCRDKHDRTKYLKHLAASEAKDEAEVVQRLKDRGVNLNELPADRNDRKEAVWSELKRKQRENQFFSGMTAPGNNIIYPRKWFMVYEHGEKRCLSQEMLKLDGHLKVAIDCGYIPLHKPFEQDKLMLPLIRIPRVSVRQKLPTSLTYVNVDLRAKWLNQFVKHYVHNDPRLPMLSLNLTGKSVVDQFPDRSPSEIIHVDLTAPKMLPDGKLDTDKLYVLDAIDNRNIWSEKAKHWHWLKNECEERNWLDRRIVRLPLEKMYRILLDMTEEGNWDTVLRRHVPRRRWDPDFVGSKEHLENIEKRHEHRMDAMWLTEYT